MEHIGPYKVLQKIAAGGMGTVYLAEHERSHGFRKLVAIKLLHPHLEVGEEAKQRFTVEARIGASLAHPNIVSVHDLDTTRDGGLFFVMEYVHGTSLRKLMKGVGRPLAPPLAALVVGEILRGLHAAHTFIDSSGNPWPVIHRDVNPKNVLISENGAVKLTDFGIAKIFDQQITVASGIRGTIGYMSPEQALGRQVDARTDIYSCAVILYELLLHRRAIEGNGEMERLANAQRGVSLDDPALAHAIPAPLLRLLHQALAPDPDARLPSAEAMLRPLEAFLAAEGPPPPRALAEIVAPHVEPLDESIDSTHSQARITLTAAAGAKQVGSRPTGLGGRRRRLLLPVGMALAFLLAASVWIALWLRGGEPGRPATPMPTLVVVADRGTAADGAPEPDAALTPDAKGVPDARAKDAASRRRRTPRRPTVRRPARSRGRLLFNTMPQWSVVWVDGKRRGNTPLELPLGVGRHRVAYRPLGRGKARRLTVRIVAGKTTRRVLTVD